MVILVNMYIYREVEKKVIFSMLFGHTRIKLLILQGFLLGPNLIFAKMFGPKANSEIKVGLLANPDDRNLDDLGF